MKLATFKKIIRNKYLIALLIFIIIIVFLDSNNLLKRFALLQEKQEIKAQIEQYDREIKENERKLNELQTSKENLEKFAREEYHMKKDNEDVFALEEIE